MIVCAQRHVAAKGSGRVQPVFGDEGPASDPRDGRRDARPHRQLGSFPRHLSRLRGPIVRNQYSMRELTLPRWGTPSPVFALKDRNSDPRRHQCPQPQIPHWRRWLGVERRCVAPFSSFSEKEALPDGAKPPQWFALDETRPLALFAGIWTRGTSVRKVKEGETTNDVFAFLATVPNNVVGSLHPRAWPAILTTREEIDRWMTTPLDEAVRLQRPLADDALRIVARGEKKDEGGLTT
ncbi:MAG: hypothetical protein FD139_2521 [Methylocystaceae bacterium]|nr:MAG: hypothetical protein FD148_128 [Methylocystaceae bacterium]KAF0212153.1 MAG: hypothetical protein FD172_1361 [Methylocystaceae bacterium]TXT44055.1 MAG: hypothetical protein FD139_2521 [Methylocystaceae bacterium]